jgi:Tfp pilus assembly protein PilO
MRSPARLWTAAGVLACLVLALASWFLVVAPQQARAAERWELQAAADAQSTALRSTIARLQRDFTQIDERRSALAVKRQSLPADDELDALVLAVNAAGAASGALVEAITSVDPIDLTPEPLVPERSEASGSPAGPSSTEPAADVWPLFAIPVTLRASGSVDEIATFLRLLGAEQPRAILFTDLTIVPGVGGATFSGDVVLTAETRVFVSPDLGPAVAEAPSE